jgi:hypothetical protein
VTKKLPVISKPVPAQSQRDLRVAPVTKGSAPEFPTRSALYRKAGVIGTATLLAGGLAHADVPVNKPVPQTARIAGEASTGGSIDGKPLSKAAPKIKVYRDGGGIGPAEDMWTVEDVEAFLSWTMAREGKLEIKTKQKFARDGVSLVLDGFDAKQNIGYIYIDGHDPQRSQITPAVRTQLETWRKAKQVSILLIDVKRYPDAAALKGKVIKFLHDVRKAAAAKR